MFSDQPKRDQDRERLNMIREAIASGTYQIDPRAVATKLILSMLEFDDDLSFLEETSSTGPEVEDLGRDEAKD
jgi:Anti-sigma-28 factor, FlgM